MAVGAKINVAPTQKCTQFTEGNRSELSSAVRADRRDIVFFHKLGHFYSPQDLYSTRYTSTDEKIF